MIKKASVIGSVISVSAVAVFLAIAPAEAKKPQDWTCSDFIQVPDKAKPNVVYWMAGFNKGGKADSLDVKAEDFKHPIGKLVTECRKNKTENLWDAIVSHFYTSAEQIP
jgi:hypothetical protein